MESEKTRHMTKIMLDDLKDAEMSLGYAQAARAEGDEAAAAVFRDEAHERLLHAKAWYEKTHRGGDDGIDAGEYHAMKCHLKEWYHSMWDRVEHIHE